MIHSDFITGIRLIKDIKSIDRAYVSLSNYAHDLEGRKCCIKFPSGLCFIYSINIDKGIHRTLLSIKYT